MTEQEVTCRKMGNKGEEGRGHGKGRRSKNVRKSTGRRENAPAENSAFVWESVSEFHFKM